MPAQINDGETKVVNGVVIAKAFYGNRVVNVKQRVAYTWAHGTRLPAWLKVDHEPAAEAEQAPEKPARKARRKADAEAEFE